MSESKERKFLATVQKEGRVTIPKLVRKVMMLKEGETVEVTVKKLEEEEKELKH